MGKFFSPEYAHTHTHTRTVAICIFMHSYLNGADLTHTFVALVATHIRSEMDIYARKEEEEKENSEWEISAICKSPCLTSLY